jgi:hypothetical protein
MNTGLVLLIPEAESLVSGWRLKHDASAAQGMPAHVTLLYPFMPFAKIDAGCHAKLAALFAGVRAFDLTFSQSERLPEIVWLLPEPDLPVRDLTRKIAKAFPDYPPYGGVYDDPTPHLTVAQGDDIALETVAAGLAGRFKAPIRSRITSCSLFALRPEGWREQRAFPLANRD